MANRTTVKNNIVTQNVPTVTNAILTNMLNTELADNLKFREDVAVSQSSGVTNITVNFTGRDRVDLTRTGGALNITVSGIADGEEVDLLITKTAGQPVTFVGITDITPIKENVTAVNLVLYSIRRKGANYYAKAWVETVVRASQAEQVTGTDNNKVSTPFSVQGKAATIAETVNGISTTKFVTPNSLQNKLAASTVLGLVSKGASSDVAVSNDTFMGVQPLYVPPSVLNDFSGGLLKTVVNIGDWNMDTTEQINVTHGLTLSKIRGVTAYIRDDGSNAFFPLDSVDNSVIIQGGISYIDANIVNLFRLTGGKYDNSNYNATSFNRGYLIIEHTI